MNKDCPEGVLGYTWTADNHVQSITAYRRGLVATHGVITNGTPADVSLSYGYDYAGRLSTVTNSGTVAVSYGYDNVGNLAAVVEKGLATNWFAYNAQNRLTTLTVTNAGKMGRQYSYGLGPTGARTNVLELTQPAGSAQQRWGAAWEYDGRYGTNAVPARAYRLTRETLTNATDWAGAITNVYDAVGNRLARSVGLAFTPAEALTNQSFRYDRRDLIDSDTVANNANTNYDADGNTLVDNGAPTGDRYDAENRLIGRGTTIAQVYDVDGNRARKTVSGVTTYYLVDDQNPTGYAQVLAEYGNLSNAPAVTYAYGLALVNQTRSGTTSWYGFDGQGNVRFLMNGSGTITDSYDYDAFGRLLAQAGTTSNLYRFAGQQWDSDLGLYYMRARYLKTDLGRFWTSDTLEGSQDEPLGLHKYLYCNGDPVNMRDPSGHDGDLGSLMMSTTIAAQLDGLYNGAVMFAGLAMQKTIIGVQNNQTAGTILKGYFIDVAKGLALGAAIGMAADVGGDLVYGGDVEGEPIGIEVNGANTVEGSQAFALTAESTEQVAMAAGRAAKSVEQNFGLKEGEGTFGTRAHTALRN